jgi:myo-inositol-1-phosphate synthase
MSFYLKSPMHNYVEKEEPIHDLFQQYILLKNAIRTMGGFEADEELD